MSKTNSVHKTVNIRFRTATGTMISPPKTSDVFTGGNQINISFYTICFIFSYFITLCQVIFHEDVLFFVPTGYEEELNRNKHDGKNTTNNITYV